MLSSLARPVPRDIEGRAVIDRCAQDRQADADVDAAIKGEQLHRDVALVVVHGDDDVELAAGGAQKDGVGRLRIGDRPAARPRGFDGGPDLRLFLHAEEPVFACVGVEPGDRDARRADAKRLAGVVRQLDHLEHARRRNAADRLLQRDVRAHVHDAQIRPHQQH